MVSKIFEPNIKTKQKKNQSVNVVFNLHKVR